MIIVTGAVGFIGSCLISKLNQVGLKNIVAVDNFDNPYKNRNLVGKVISRQIERDNFFQWVKKNSGDIDFFFHLGARTNTLETSAEIFDKLNLKYSKEVWRFCSKAGIPLLYASSAATYGDWKFGYKENLETTRKLTPLNPYAEAKHQFDLWAFEQDEKPPVWTGLKFFNVYGPNEYHKGKMASMVYQAYQQIKNTGTVKLFKSYRENFDDGTQKRDFIYVKDIVDLCIELMDSPQSNKLLNAGTGKAKDFNYLVRCVFKALHKPENILYIDMPLEIRGKYQYCTEADTTKCTNRGILTTPQNLDLAIDEYVKQYLEGTNYY